MTSAPQWLPLKRYPMSNRTNCAVSPMLRLGPVFCAALVLGTSVAEASVDLPIEIQNTRVIFNEGQPSSFVAIRNKSNTPYLVGLEITQFCGTGKSCAATEDFMTSPGFKVISPGQTFPFRIVKLAENLPDDKESLYLVNFKLLPSNIHLSDRDVKKARVTVAVAGSIKLFWRPKNLANTSGVLTVRDMLAANCANAELEIINRSAYWGTFGTLDALGRTLLQDGPLPMVPPFSSVRFAVPSCPQSISVSFIAESGLMTAKRAVPVWESSVK